MTLLECGIIFGGIPAGAISRKGGLIWGIPDQIITGNPDTVIRKLKVALDVVDPGSLVLWDREGPMSHQVAMRSIDLMTQEVIPAVKEYQADRERGRKSLATA